MEENYEKRKSKLPLLIGILSLILVLSVGGVYAYFSARATNSGQNITGRTLDINGSTLTIAATRLNLNPSPAPVSDNLLPAKFGVDPTEITTTEVNKALTKACVVGGYTGCHVWKITASATQDIPTANIRLNLNVNTVTDKDEWSYVVYTGTDSSAGAVLNKGLINTDFGNTTNTIDIHNGASLSNGTPAIYYVMVYLNNTNSVQNDGVNDNTTNETGTYNGSVILEAMGGEVKVNFLDDAVEYITNLYNNAEKSTATVNNITYNLAPSVGLMNDRHASMSTDINGGDIRFYGANPNNYVWLGDSYTGGNWTSYGAPFADVTACNDWATQQNITGEQIQEITNNKYSTVAEFCTTGEQKKLWRIVGIFDGRLKLVSNDPISTTTGLSWDTSANTTGGNAGYGINQWGPSDTYEGADIMRLLNPGYEGESINNSLYWTKGTGTVYTGLENATTSNVSFANTGLTANERNMIDTATWYTGAYDNISYVDAHYTAERGSMGKICTQGTSECDDTVTRINTWNGKVGLISASDYGYAADLSQCNQILNNYSSCTSSNWLFIGIFEWTMSSRANSGYAYNVFFVFGNGGLDYADANNGNAVRPAVFLKSGVSIDIDGKDGSFEHPYVLSLN